MMVAYSTVELLLGYIGQYESDNNYDAMYGPAEVKLGKHQLRGMTLAEIDVLQEKMKRYGSSAVGKYQFLDSTLADIKKALGWSDSMRFTEDIQDAGAIWLLQRRGLTDYLAGKMTEVEFGNNLAKEWASLPVLSDSVRLNKDGSRTYVKRGQSYYVGVQGNKAHADPDDFRFVLRELRVAAGRPPDVEKPTPPPSERDAENSWLTYVVVAIIIAVTIAVGAFALLK